MSKDVIYRIKNFLMLSILLPVVYGCGGGGGGGDLASLFGGSPSSGSSVVTGGGGEIIIGGGGVEEILPTLHNPEPATLLLIGSGIAAIGYLKRHKR